LDTIGLGIVKLNKLSLTITEFTKLHIEDLRERLRGFRDLETSSLADRFLALKFK